MSDNKKSNKSILVDDDLFSESKDNIWKKRGKTVDAMPRGIDDFLSKKKKRNFSDDFDGFGAEEEWAPPQAVVKVVSFGAGATSAKAQIDYLSRGGTLEMELDDGTFVRGTDEAHELIEEWSNDFQYRGERSRNTMHLIVSAPAGSNRESVLDASRQFAKDAFGDNHQYAFVAHEDCEHPHVHFIIKMCGDDGRNLHLSNSDYHYLRETFARNCRENGIDMIASKHPPRGYNPRQYDPMKDGVAREHNIPSRNHKTSMELPFIDLVPSDKRISEVDVKMTPMESDAAYYRVMADSISSLGRKNHPEIDEFFKEANKLRSIAEFLEKCGHIDQTEQSKDTDMAEQLNEGISAKPDDRDKEIDPINVMDEARHKADRGIEVARQITDKMPPGADRDTAEAALSGMSRMADKLHGREHEIDKVSWTGREANEPEANRRETDDNIYNPTDAEVRSWVRPEADGTSRQEKAMIAEYASRPDREERPDREDTEELYIPTDAEVKAWLTRGPDGLSPQDRAILAEQASRPGRLAEKEREITEPDREMKTGGLDKNVQIDRVATGLEKENDLEQPKAGPVEPETGKERMAKINERNAQLAIERERNPDMDRDR